MIPTTAAVKELRAMTGAGILLCRQAIEATDTMEAAVDWLRAKGIERVSGRQGRIAAEGTIAAYIDPDTGIGAMVELNCETDFVARTAEFRAAAQTIARAATLIEESDDVLELSQVMFRGKRVGDIIRDLASSTGENIRLRRSVRFEMGG